MLFPHLSISCLLSLLKASWLLCFYLKFSYIYDWFKKSESAYLNIYLNYQKIKKQEDLKKKKIHRYFYFLILNVNLSTGVSSKKIDSCKSFANWQWTELFVFNAVGIFLNPKNLLSQA